jgi:hypothetical protein
MSKATYTKDEFIDKIISKTKSNVIQITEDKLENILIKNTKYLDSKSVWITPFSLLLTLILSLLTSNFKDFIGIPKETWQSLFYIGTVLIGIWFFVSLSIVYKHRKKSTIEYLLSQITKTNQDVD